MSDRSLQSATEAERSENLSLYPPTFYLYPSWRSMTAFKEIVLLQ
jgi:hypothetical protein